MKSGRLTSASGCLSWPTIRASEYKDTGPIGSKSHDHMLGKGYLCAVVTQDAWQTPTTNMDMVRSEEGVQKRIAFRASIGRKSIPDGNLGEQMQRVVKDAANWPTATATNRVRNEETLAKCAAFRKRNANQNTVPLYLEEVVLREEQHGQAAPAIPSTDGSRQESWPTITAHTPDMESSGPNGNSGTYLAGAVKAEENWVTPRTSGTSTRPNKTTPRQGLTLIEQAREQEKMWRTPSVAEEKNQNTSTQIYLQNQVGATPKAWATPQASDHIEGARTELTSNQKCLGRDMKEWGTPTARDHKSGRGNEEREYKELTPMVERTQTGKLNPRWVETLMGLPVGWVMPSCKSPVTIALTSCACSETESSQPQPSELLES